MIAGFLMFAGSATLRPMKLRSITWQISTTLLICACAPVLGDLIVWIAMFASRRIYPTSGPPIKPLGGVLAFLFSLPIAYTFASIPALIVGIIYCANLTAFPLLRRSLIGRALLGFLIGGVIVALWCWMLRWGLWLYGSGAAVATGILALRWPRHDQKSSLTDAG
jgi:hypothetical protein